MKVSSDTFPPVFILKFDRASGETVSGTQRYILKVCLKLLKLIRAYGEAILGTQRYFPKAFLIKISSRLRRGGFGFWLRGGRSSLGRLTFIKGGLFPRGLVYIKNKDKTLL